MPAAALRVVLAALSLVVLLAGCTVATPSAGDWRATAARSLEDSASAVSTARLALREQEAERTWSTYAVTLAADAEKQTGTATDGVATLQRPEGVGVAEAAAVMDLLGRAEDVVRRARQHLVAGGPPPDALLERLDTVAQQLTRAAGRLG